ncbi:hypothetical protein BBK82_04960 [Lentzea guizhouensis]|uniref:Minor tail protein n=1 Tax=Lentzea guizhouensis TaxID=1586287 RepID=A0A1B2HCX0_9PSEU|nr:hypothetical protein [Lentzea guizhouensis]ANZ35526.1 hypothetical protein BBK82_04960 [Lentzea guizhouensis]
MALPVYRYQIADLATNRILEDVRLTGVSFNKPLNGSGRFDATWKLGAKTRHLDAYDLTMPTRRCIYAWRDDRPMWGGIIWTRKYSSTSQTVTIGAGEWWSYFDHRAVLPLLPASPGIFDLAGLAAPSYAGIDQNQIARNLVALAQSHTGGDIGIRLDLDTTTSGQLRDRTYPPYKLSNAGEMLRNLTGVIGGQDMVFDVAASSTGAAAPDRVLLQGTPWLGQQGSSHVWELTGSATSYEWDSDGTRMATRAYAVGEGVDLGTPIAVSEDSSKYAIGFPLLELDTSYDGDDPDVLGAHAQGDQEAARLPVVLPRFVVRGDVPPTAADVSRGDDGRLIIPAGDLFHRRGWDGPVRVVDIKYSPSASAERLEITAAPMLDDVA